MRIQELRLSNILSFGYEDDIDNAFNIAFDPALNIIIGGNGSGKSTSLEAINFIFRRVLFRHYQFNQQNFNDPRTPQKKATLMVDDQAIRVSPFRLQPNWQTEDDEQTIKAVLTLDDIDKSNIQNVIDNYSEISTTVSKYSTEIMPIFTPIDGNESVALWVSFSRDDDSYTVTYDNASEHIRFYLEKYLLITEAISMYNKTHSGHIDLFNSTFAMLSAFRNYTTFSLNSSLSSDPQEHLRNIRSNDSNRSNNIQDGEPSIFNIVKMKLGEHHFKLMQGKDTVESATKKVNSLQLVDKINAKLRILNLQFSIGVTDVRNWSYEFKFFDTKHQRDMGNINNLSAGQKSIIHLIFEAYGQDDMKGGVVIIDEPEIHLHYQFQYEYIRILEDLTTEQKTQYIIVTHSEGFISSGTAAYIKRFSLNQNRYSAVYAPQIAAEQKKLIEILDNTQSARALFANKVVLVEGQDDEYFFRTALKSYIPEMKQDIAIYNAHSKDSIPSWKEFFESFGVVVYFVKDLDATSKDLYGEPNISLKTIQSRASFKTTHPDLTARIEAEYLNKGFYLKAGAIEQYTQRQKGIKNVIEFCKGIDTFLQEDSGNSNEIIKIIDEICDN